MVNSVKNYFYLSFVGADMVVYLLVALVSITMMALTVGVSRDAHQRNKYASPWFLLVSLTGLFGVLFYYITIRTEETAESLPEPSRLVRYGTVILGILGAVILAPAIIGLATGHPYLLIVFGCPATAAGYTLYLDFQHDVLQRQKIFSELAYSVMFGLSFATIIVTQPNNEQVSGASGMLVLAGALLALIAFPLSWYRLRKPRVFTALRD